MRRLSEKLFQLTVFVHVFVNNRRVKAAGSLLYVTGAIVITLLRNQLRLVDRTLLQLPAFTQVKLLVVAGMSNVSTLIQHAETMFR